MSGGCCISPGRGNSAAGSVLEPGLDNFIGKIQTVVGSGTLTRSGGMDVPLKVGDPVCRGDIIETSADGRVGIRFIDGTVFSVSNSARMVLREFVCEGTSPSALLDITSGTFAFFGGEMAKAGALAIDTPHASIRGRSRSGGIGMLFHRRTVLRGHGGSARNLR